MSLLVKVCGMTSVKDAAMCEELGANFLGFIFHPSSPRNVGADFARSIKTEGAKKVGVFVKQSVAEVIEILKNGNLDFAQLHGGQNEEFCKAVGKERVIKVLWPQKYESLKELQADIDRFAPHCAYMLFDAGKSGGGHGVAMAFNVFKDVTIPVPWLLAGGLSAENLSDALSTAKPNGVDLNSGVESEPGKKDKNKLGAAFAVMNR
ncbi:phosphoribosylanthranilate isomerase [Desulfovibrio sp. JC022]|uniref:phosphoribosylanthranilate isomerase n=1 Tax=Desulfovibrio sp. JC022 TaxID=2593642 RepID=UPI0013D7278A|nr:phosphoribosylanthranilate isomerase [Desulfovibrio sp. JC022]NDV22837.1 phosphoribosylanthranilate isomerase [Desulfovibrio sp. JC022]